MPGLKYAEVEVRNLCILDVFICPQLLLVFPRWMLVMKTKEDVLIFKGKGKVMLLDFNARVGTASEIDEVIGMFGEETSNNNGEKLVSFLTEVDLVPCNGRTFVTEPEWTCIHVGLKQKSIIDYIITDMQILKKSGKLCR